MSLDNDLICILKCDEGYPHLVIKMVCDRYPIQESKDFIQ